MPQYLVEQKSFRHQRLTPSAVTQSGTQPDGTPQYVHSEPEPDAMAAFQAYLDDRGGDSWELVQFERLATSSTTYTFLFVFTKP